jgi:Fe-S oxidoreductase
LNEWQVKEMTLREGNLEAPTRHPLDWNNPEFYETEKVNAEMERVFDLCHGCRRCVNLCNAFPTLFDLVDATKEGEVEGVAKADYQQVVDQCYLCDVCYMTKCPYTPPHPWNIDFPHLMLRAKAANFKAGKTSYRDKFISSTDGMGYFAGIPIVTKTINLAHKNRMARNVMQSVLDVDKNAWIPEYAEKTFPQLAKTSADFEIKNGQRTPGKVAIYATCFVKYHEPGIGQDLIKILEHNAIPYVLVEKEVCCGMPKLELGDLESVAANKEKNIPKMAKLAKEGYAILTSIPSCTLMFKQELPLMFPEDADVQLVKEAMWDPFEYFIARNKDGLLKNDFKKELGHVSYHVPCHSRVQNLGQKTAEILKMIPGTELNVVERCSGHAGTWGVKDEYHEISKKIGKPVFKRMAEDTPNYISSDCQLAAHHIEQGMEELGLPKIALAHPLTLMAIAYGL